MMSLDHDVARAVLEGDADAIGLTIRWISAVLTSPRFWPLRADWPDLVQESLARVVESLHKGRFDPTKSFHAYVQGVARYTATEALREAHRRRSGGDFVAEAGVLVSDRPSVADSVAVAQIVRRVLDEASEDCRLLMRLYFLEEKGYEEIARELILPVGTVKSRLSRCLDCAERGLRVAIRRPVEEGATR